MKYIIIGLGNYGGMLATDLSALGNEVIGADSDEHRVDAIKDKIATAFILDVTDEASLSALPLNDVDVVIVAIGENFGASVRAVALLKQRNVKHIYARAMDELHKAVLEAFNLDKILTPEKDAARELSQLLDIGMGMESFKIDEEYYVLKFKVPSKFIGYKFNELKLSSEFNLKMIALECSIKAKNILGISVTRREVNSDIAADYLIQADDEMVCYGRYKDFQSLWKAL
ncbi:MAG: TrkA family potassium uptake protein [Bacteroides sp.]